VSACMNNTKKLVDAAFAVLHFEVLGFNLKFSLHSLLKFCLGLR